MRYWLCQEFPNVGKCTKRSSIQAMQQLTFHLKAQKVKYETSGKNKTYILHCIDGLFCVFFCKYCVCFELKSLYDLFTSFLCYCHALAILALFIRELKRLKIMLEIGFDYLQKNFLLLVFMIVLKFCRTKERKKSRHSLNFK